VVEVKIKTSKMVDAALYASVLDWLLTNIYRPSIVMTNHKNNSKEWKADDVWVFKVVPWKGRANVEFKNEADAVAFKLAWG